MVAKEFQPVAQIIQELFRNVPQLEPDQVCISTPSLANSVKSIRMVLVQHKIFSSSLQAYETFWRELERRVELANRWASVFLVGRRRLTENGGGRGSGGRGTR